MSLLPPAVLLLLPAATAGPAAAVADELELSLALPSSKGGVLLHELPALTLLLLLARAMSLLLLLLPGGLMLACVKRSMRISWSSAQQYSSTNVHHSLSLQAPYLCATKA